ATNYELRDCLPPLYNECRSTGHSSLGGTGGRFMFERIKSLFSKSARENELQKQLAELRTRLPVPVFWLYGKTQSGKTSVIKYLTGAERAEIGRGFQPCTRFSQEYQFPT